MRDHHAYGLPVVISDLLNNFGPCDFEKLPALAILNALEGKPLQLHGKGRSPNWLYVEDHARALFFAKRRRIGHGYNVGTIARLKVLTSPWCVRSAR